MTIFCNSKTKNGWGDGILIKVTLIALGKLKEKYLRDAVDEYSKDYRVIANLI